MKVQRINIEGNIASPRKFSDAPSRVIFGSERKGHFYSPPTTVIWMCAVHKIPNYLPTFLQLEEHRASIVSNPMSFITLRQMRLWPVAGPAWSTKARRLSQMLRTGAVDALLSGPTRTSRLCKFFINSEVVPRMSSATAHKKPPPHIVRKGFFWGKRNV